MYLYSKCINKVKPKPLCEDWILGVLKCRVSKTNVEKGSYIAVLLEVTMYAAHIGSNRSHFLTAGMSDVPILGALDTSSSRYCTPIVNAHIRSNRNHFFDGWVLGVLNIKGQLN